MDQPQPQHPANTHFPRATSSVTPTNTEKSSVLLGTDNPLSNERSKQGHVKRLGWTFFIVTTGTELAQSLLSTFVIRDLCMEIRNSVFFMYLDCKG